MSRKTKTLLVRFARGAGAVLVAYAIGKISGPDFLDLVPDPYDVGVTGILVPALLSLEKWLRYGEDPGEVNAEVPGPTTD